MENTRLGGYTDIVSALLAGDTVTVPATDDFVPSSLRSAFSRGQLQHAASLGELGVAYKSRRLIFSQVADVYHIKAVLHKEGKFKFTATPLSGTGNGDG